MKRRSQATPSPHSLLQLHSKGMIGALRFLWNATRGHRFSPWRSPYLRWRLETYSGQHAELITAGDTVRFLWKEKHQFLRFLQWTEEMRRDAGRH